MSNNVSKTVGVFFGSRSPEHDVSIITADMIISGLREMGISVVPIYISKDGRWYIHEDLDLDFLKSEDAKAELSQLREYTLDLQSSVGKMVFYSKKGFLGSSEITIDLAFPAFHGPNGEDGVAQGLFELCSVPYVGSGVAASARAMDKVETKLLYQRFKIPTTEFTYLMKQEWESHREEIVDEAAEIGFPLFVKPARAGSSIGISRVTNKEDLEFSIDVALHYDSKVLVEKGVENVGDLTVAVLGNDELQASLIQESQFSDDFFSYEDKYLNDGGAQLGNADKNIVIPADLEDDVAEEIREMAMDIYRLFECAGTARVDFLYDRDEETVYANEINTLPGTLYHHLWDKTGTSLSELLQTLLQLAMERHNAKQNLMTTFDSDILMHADGGKMGQKMEDGEAEEVQDEVVDTE